MRQASPLVYKVGEENKSLQLTKQQMRRKMSNRGMG